MKAETHVGDIDIPDEERQPCEVWSRVMGYYRPVTEFNIGKQQEHRDRKFWHADTDEEIVNYCKVNK